MRIAQILHNKAHWIFEADEMPAWPPDPDGNPIVLLDITDQPEVQEGWDYDGETFTAPAEPEPQPEPAPEPLSDQEQLLLDTAINTEYLVTLADLGL